MFAPDSFSVAMVMMVLSATCWGSWANTYKLTTRLSLRALLLGLRGRHRAHLADSRPDDGIVGDVRRKLSHERRGGGHEQHRVGAHRRLHLQHREPAARGGHRDGGARDCVSDLHRHRPRRRCRAELRPAAQRRPPAAGPRCGPGDCRGHHGRQGVCQPSERRSRRVAQEHHRLSRLGRAHGIVRAVRDAGAHRRSRAHAVQHRRVLHAGGAVVLSDRQCATS